jgi:hypothetical protein
MTSHPADARHGDHVSAAYAFTRDQLVDAIACIELRVPQSGPMAGKIPAESMADAIITALGMPDHLVHWRWPPACMPELVRRDTWTGDRGRVTCPACVAAPD